MNNNNNNNNNNNKSSSRQQQQQQQQRSVVVSLSEDARRQANLRVLQRSDPAIVDIVGFATHVGLYEYTSESKWEKTQVEGSLFLCQRRRQQQQQRQPSGADGLWMYRWIILNRHSQDNTHMDLTTNVQLQNQEPYLIVRWTTTKGGDARQQPQKETVIKGIWFHNSQERDQMATAVQQAVEKLRRQEQEQEQQIAAKPTMSSEQQQQHRITTATALSNLLLSPQNLTTTTAAPTTTAPSPSPSSYNSTPQPSHPSPLLHHHNNNNNKKEATEPKEDTAAAVHPSSSSTESFVLDKKSLQLSLLSLIQDERFLDLIHAQYLKVAHARANRKGGGGGGEH